MKEIGGNEVAVELRKRFKNVVLVFCSGVYKPSPENIKVAPFRFLLKEYSKEKMLEEFSEIFEYLKNKKDEPAILCYDKKYTIKVNISEIIYASIARRGTEIHTYDTNHHMKTLYTLVENDKKKIKVQMYMENDGAFSVIKIENSFNGTLLCDGDELKSTKEDGEPHGLGIKSVRNVAEKYNGWIKNSWEKDTFKVLLVLENSLFDL